MVVGIVTVAVGVFRFESVQMCWNTVSVMKLGGLLLNASQVCSVMTFNFHSLGYLGT
jgi:hypothetical protein